MDTKPLLKTVFAVGLFVGAALLTYYQFFAPQNNPIYSTTPSSDNSLGWKFPVYKFLPGGKVSDSTAFSELRKSGVPSGLPVRLQVPSIAVDTAIEDAYITPDGRMDVPAGSVNVAWFALGIRPGQIGSAVIGGHYGIDRGTPKVFYNLNKLKVGDKAYTIDDKGNTSSFVVRSVKIFDRNADATSVFISNDNQAHLNLIACDGVWNRVNDTYPDRRVVFTDAIAPSDTEERVSPVEPIVIKPSLPETAISPLITPQNTIVNVLGILLVVLLGYLLVRAVIY